jgi:hypothetical protein
LARSFRYYGKKRGNRRTGSPVWASASEAVFFAVLLILGCGGSVLLFTTQVVPEWRANYEFAAATCKVLDKRIVEARGADGSTYRPEVKIEYVVDGVTYSDWRYDIHHTAFGSRDGAQAILDQFTVYDKSQENLFACWYNPVDPHEAVLVRGSRWWFWLVFTVPISFIVIGAGGLIYTVLHWGKSAEARAAMARRAKERDLFAAVGRGDRNFPFIPQGDNITNSPGTKLQYRLPAAGSVGWFLSIALAFCVVWNACAVLAVVWAVHSFAQCKPDWILVLFVIPVVLIGIGSIFYLVRRLLIATGIGLTLVEISGHPLHPGQRYRVAISQAAQRKVNLLQVSLVCEETAVFRQGTNTRTETQEVYRQELLRQENLESKREQPFEIEFDLEVPHGAMHSFLADHNQIHWSLVVEGDVVRRPKFRRAFAVIVHPAPGDHIA